MPYAANDRITQKHFDGGIEITDEQYAEACAWVHKQPKDAPRHLVRVHGETMYLTQRPNKQEGCKAPVWGAGEWVHEPLPEPTEEELKEKRIAELISQLNTIDFATVRPLRAQLNGTATQADTDKLASLEAQAVVLRAELEELKS